MGVWEIRMSRPVLGKRADQAVAHGPALEFRCELCRRPDGEGGECQNRGEERAAGQAEDCSKETEGDDVGLGRVTWLVSGHSFIPQVKWEEIR